MNHCLALTSGLQKDKQQYHLQSIKVVSCKINNQDTVVLNCKRYVVESKEEIVDQKQSQQSSNYDHKEHNIDLKKIDQMKLSDNNSKITISYEPNDETEYEIMGCSIVIIQIILNLRQAINNKNIKDDAIKIMIEKLIEKINSQITHSLSEIIESIYYNLIQSTCTESTSKVDQAFKSIDCIKKLIQLNSYLNSLWMKVIKNDLKISEIYTINNLTNDIKDWCIGFTSKYLTFSSLFMDKMLPLLLNALQSISHIKHKIKTMSKENQTDDIFLPDLNEDISIIIHHAFISIVDQMKHVKNIGSATDFVHFTLDSLNNHNNIFMKIINKYIYLCDENNWNNDVIKILLKPFSEFISNKMEMIYNIEAPKTNLLPDISELQLNSPQIPDINPLKSSRSDSKSVLMEKTLQKFMSKTRLCFSWFISNCCNDNELRLEIEKLEAKCFDILISSEMHSLSTRLEEIEDAINSDELSNLNESCYDEEEHCYYGTSIISVINILDPIMGKINVLPMQQHHILELAEFFTSTAAHYVISLTKEINNNKLLSAKSSKFVIPDNIYILLGTLHKFDSVLKQYLQNMNIIKKYNESRNRS
eukprot:15647_1